MGQPKIFIIIMLVWFFGWGFSLSKFPRQCCRIFSLGKEPSPKNLRIAKIVSYMGFFFGVLLINELAFGMIKAN